MAKCEPDCTCKRHSHPGGSSKCKPGCTCDRHKAKGKKNPHPEGCQCGVHKTITAEEKAERGRLISEAKRGNNHSGGFVSRGYFVLLLQKNHPLAAPDGKLYEHRKVLYDKIGPGPHLCHWGCGKLLDWGGKQGICADHLDGDRLNNTPENIVPSCMSCNRERHDKETGRKCPPECKCDRHTNSGRKKEKK